jgi:hypothetical protein
MFEMVLIEVNRTSVDVLGLFTVFSETSQQPASEKGIIQVGKKMVFLQPFAKLFRSFGSRAVVCMEAIKIELPLQGLPLLLVEAVAKSVGEGENVVF